MCGLGLDVYRWLGPRFRFFFTLLGFVCDAQHLHCVSCSGNGIGAEGAKAIAEALKVNGTVHTLHLSGMPLSVFLIYLYRCI